MKDPPHSFAYSDSLVKIDMSRVQSLHWGDKPPVATSGDVCGAFRVSIASSCSSIYTCVCTRCRVSNVMFNTHLVMDCAPHDTHQSHTRCAFKHARDEIRYCLLSLNLRPLRAAQATSFSKSPSTSSDKSVDDEGDAGADAGEEVAVHTAAPLISTDVQPSPVRAGATVTATTPAGTAAATASTSMLTPSVSTRPDSVASATAVSAASVLPEQVISCLPTRLRVHECDVCRLRFLNAVRTILCCCM